MVWRSPAARGPHFGVVAVAESNNGGGSPFLTNADVARLMADPSAASRAATAIKLAEAFGAGGLSARERRLAEEIFRAMARDVEVRVREMLSLHVRNFTDLPHDVAIALARDVAEVSLPMLESSVVFTDEDLIEIVCAKDPAKQVAIAKRKVVSTSVASALVDAGNEDAVATLVANEGADISEQAMHRAVDRFGSSERVHGPMVRRGRLPMRVAERLVSMVSDKLREHLVTHHELPPAVAADLVIAARERATASLLDDSAVGGDIVEFVRHLKRNGRLTETLLLRAACIGDIKFLEASFAELASVPLTNVQLLMHDEGKLGMTSLYERTGLPKQLLPAFRAAVTVAHDTNYDGAPNDRARFGQRIVERILTQADDSALGMAKSDVDYLLSKLDQFIKQTRA